MGYSVKRHGHLVVIDISRRKRLIKTGGLSWILFPKGSFLNAGSPSGKGFLGVKWGQRHIFQGFHTFLEGFSRRPSKKVSDEWALEAGGLRAATVTK